MKKLTVHFKDKLADGTPRILNTVIGDEDMQIDNVHRTLDVAFDDGKTVYIYPMDTISRIKVEGLPNE